MSSIQPATSSPDPNAADVQVAPAAPAQSARPGGRPGASPTDQALDASSRVGEYHVVRMLSADETGFTYLARDLLLHRDLVVAEHLPFALAHRNASGQVVLATAGDANAFIMLQRSFIEAAQRHARFDHPACMPLWRCWYSNGTAYAAMPYHGGTTLTEMRRTMTRPPEEQWLRAVAKPLLDALESLHAQPVLHLGISPDRVAIRADGRAVLLAAGTSRALAPAHPMAPFQPPELRIPSEHLPLGAWSDFYSVAATLFFAITGESPPMARQGAPGRADSTLIGPLGRAMTDLSARWPQVSYSPGLVRTIDRALSPLPAARPQSAQQFRASLDAPDIPRASPEPEAPVRHAAAAVPPRPAPAERAEPRPTARPATPEAKTVPVLTDTAKVQPDAKVTWFGPTDPSIAADLRKTLGSPLPHPDPTEPDPWVATRYQEPKPARRSRWPRFALTAVLAMGVLGIAAHFWNEQQRGDEVRSRLSSLTGDRTRVVVPPAPHAQPAVTLPAAQPTRRSADTESSRDAAALPVPERMAAQQQPSPPIASPQPEVARAPSPVTLPGDTVANGSPSTNSAALGFPAKAPAANPVTSATPAAAPAAPVPATPRAACAGRSNFSLVYCMEQQCARERFRNHPQCVSLRETGEVE